MWMHPESSGHKGSSRQKLQAAGACSQASIKKRHQKAQACRIYPTFPIDGRHEPATSNSSNAAVTRRTPPHEKWEGIGAFDQDYAYPSCHRDCRC